MDLVSTSHYEAWFGDQTLDKILQFKIGITYASEPRNRVVFPQYLLLKTTIYSKNQVALPKS